MPELRPTAVDNAIRAPRVRKLIRLIGELRELGVGEMARQHLANTLLHDIGAMVGGVVLDGNYRIGKTNTFQGVTLVGFDEHSAEVFAVHSTAGSDINPYHREMMKKPATEAGEIRMSELPRSEWDNSLFANDYALPVGLDHFLGSIRTLGSYRCEGLGLMRAKGDQPFSAEDREVLSVFFTEAPRFFGDPQIPLAPRIRRTLEELLLGKSDKEIAACLELSPHTVHQYVKELYRRYRVHSRVELMSKARAQK